MRGGLPRRPLDHSLYRYREGKSTERVSSGQIWKTISYYLILMSQWKRRPASCRSLSFRKKIREKRKSTKVNYKVESKERTIRKDGETSR